MRKISTLKIALILIGAVGAGGIYVLLVQNQKPGALDNFAVCLGEKGAKFYGAYWCHICQSQKVLFGKSAKKLPYVECSSPDGKTQLPLCAEKDITGYPTWTFADGSRQTGSLPLEELAEKTGCSFPR